MPKLPRRKTRPRRAFGTVLLLWDVWRRIPPRKRKKLLALARKHGPRIVKTAYKARRARRRFLRR